MGVCGKELILQFQAFSFQINKNSRDGSSFYLIIYDVEFRPKNVIWSYVFAISKAVIYCMK